MRIANLAKSLRAVRFFRLCLGIIVSLTLAMGGTVLNIQPVQALDIVPPPPPNFDVVECQTFTYTFANDGSFACPGPGYIVYYWLWGALPQDSTWDMNTGVLTVCPRLGSSTAVPGGVYNFNIAVVSMDSTGCWDFGTTVHNCSITVWAASGITPLMITPTIFPAAWENIPYFIILTATGCSATPIYNWTATNLPAGLTLDPLTGILSGTPAPGTCGPWTVMVTCTDTSMCPSAGCCPPTTAPLYLYVDCWANYLALITAYPTTTCDFEVQIGPGLTYGQTPVQVDGAQKATLGANQSYAIVSDTCESHLVVVAQTINGQDPDTKFECIGPNSKMVTDTDNIAYFDYARSVYIKTGSDPGIIPPPAGAGWYAVNSGFSTTTPGTVVSQSDSGVKFVFDSYSLPDGGTFPGRDLVFSVNNKGTVTAHYKPYYRLQLKSDSPYVVDESSWWPADGKATWELALQPIPMPNFWGGIGGTLEPVNGTGSHDMTGPYTQKIEWRPNWFWPIFWIVVTLLAIAAAIFFGLRYSKRGKTSTAGAATQIPADATTSVKAAPADSEKSLPKAAPEEPITVMPPLSAAPPDKKALSEAETAGKPGFCTNCGAKVLPGAKFCKACGANLTGG